MKLAQSFVVILVALFTAFTGFQAASAQPTAGPGDITCGHFSNDQVAAQEYFEANGHPYNLDGDGDGQACASPEDGDYTGGPTAGPEDESESPADDTNDDGEMIAELPSTGSGAGLPVAASGIGILLALGLIVAAGGLQGNRTLRR